MGNTHLYMYVLCIPTHINMPMYTHTHTHTHTQDHQKKRKNRHNFGVNKEQTFLPTCEWFQSPPVNNIRQYTIHTVQ